MSHYVYCVCSQQVIAKAISWTPAAPTCYLETLLTSRHKISNVISTVVDRFSKMAHFIALPKLPTAKETAEVILNHIFHINGLQRDVVSGAKQLIW